MSDEDKDLVNASSSVVSGRAFFFGGISPLFTRSCTSTHAEKFVGFARSNLSAVKSSPALLYLGVVALETMLLDELPVARRKAAFADGPATANNMQTWTNTFIAWIWLTFTQSPPGSQVNTSTRAVYTPTI
jgi:hypothetical protein